VELELVELFLFTRPQWRIHVRVGQALEIEEEGTQSPGPTADTTFEGMDGDPTYKVVVESDRGSQLFEGPLDVNLDNKAMFRWRWPEGDQAFCRLRVYRKASWRGMKSLAAFVIRRASPRPTTQDGGGSSGLPASSTRAVGNSRSPSPVQHSAVSSTYRQKGAGGGQGRPVGARPVTRTEQNRAPARPADLHQLLIEMREQSSAGHNEASTQLAGFRREVKGFRDEASQWFESVSDDLHALRTRLSSNLAEEQDRLRSKMNRLVADYRELQAQLEQEKSEHAKTTTRLDRAHKNSTLMNRSQPEKLVARVKRIVEFAEAREPDSATGLAFDPQRVQALGQHLDRVADLAGDLDCAPRLAKMAREWLGSEVPPLVAARQAVDRQDVGGSLDHYLAHLERSGEDSGQRGEEFYSGAVRGAVKEIWADSAAVPGSFERTRSDLETLLGVLDLELVIPEEGMTFNHKTQQAVHRVASPEGYARNSIVKVVRPGFRARGGDLIEKAQVSIAKD